MTALMRVRSGVTAAVLLGSLSLLAACSEAPPVSTPELLVLERRALPDTPDDPVWQEAPFHRAQLLLQDMVEPRQMNPSTPWVEVQAVTDGARIAFLLRWPDASVNDLPDTGRFSDACAVQLPLATEPDVPAPQMGETHRPVEITYWRASWQGWVDGRPDEIRSIHPNAAVDHYPFEAASLEPGSGVQRELASQYAPARALGRAMEGPRERPVEDLVAHGPGSLAPAAEQVSSGSGRRTNDGWEVVLIRPRPDGLSTALRSHVALAVWDGAAAETGARKMRSGWIPLHLQEEPS